MPWGYERNMWRLRATSGGSAQSGICVDIAIAIRCRGRAVYMCKLCGCSESHEAWRHVVIIECFCLVALSSVCLCVFFLNFFQCLFICSNQDMRSFDKKGKAAVVVL